MQQLQPVNDSRRDKVSVIVDAACRVIREKGYHQARITDIAQAAGISYGLVYHYFKSKAELFDTILSQWWGSLFSVMEECDRRYEDVQGKLGALVGYFLDEYEKRPDMVHLFITEISRSSVNLTPARLKWFKVFIDRVENIMVAAQSQNALRDDIKARYLTYIFLGAIETFISTMVLENHPIRSRSQKQRIATGLLEVFFNGARSLRQ
jgi:TetR/AcrR family transcriptional regulator, fatty acid metabolism regulator protein